GARLEVNTAAAVTGCPSPVATRARSGAAGSLIPQATPPARKPPGAVTLTTAPSPRLEDMTCGSRKLCPRDGRGVRRARSRVHGGEGQAGALVQAERQVGALHGLAGRALDQVVERAQDDDPSCPVVAAGGQV